MAYQTRRRAAGNSERRKLTASRRRRAFSVPGDNVILRFLVNIAQGERASAVWLGAHASGVK